MLNDLFLSARKKEIEKKAMPLWLANYAIKNMKNETCISYEEYISKILNEDEIEKTSSPLRTAEEIESDFQKIVEHYRKENGLNG